MTDSTRRERARPRPLRRVFAGIALLTLSLVAPLLATAGPADAHGAATLPGSRTYLCRIDGTSSGGDIEPKNSACAAAVQLGGKQPLWDWFGVLRGDGAGRTRGFIPDGQLCSGGEPKYAGYDLPRADWPHTRLTGGAAITFRYNAWAAHPGEFRMYITRDGYDPTAPLRWDDLEAEPFSTYAQTQPNGNDAQNGSPDYQWPATLPNKTGRHIIYSVWERSDSAETFYNCSDVVFDGGGGEVVGVGAGAVPVSTPSSGDTAPATTLPPTTTTAPSSVPPSSTQDPADAASNPAPAEGAIPAEESTGDGLAGAAADTPTDTSTGTSTDTSTGTVIDASTGTVIVDPEQPAEVAADTLTAGIDSPAPAPSESSGGGPGWGLALLIGLVGLALGVAGTIAVTASVQSRQLRAELDAMAVAQMSQNWPTEPLAMEQSEPIRVTMDSC